MDLNKIINQTSNLFQDLQETMKYISEPVFRATILVPIDLVKYIYYKAIHKTSEQIESNDHGTFCLISTEFNSYLKLFLSKKFCSGNGNPDSSRTRKGNFFHCYLGCDQNDKIKTKGL